MSEKTENQTEKTENLEQDYRPKVETLTSMARRYKMDYRSFKKCIAAIRHKIKNKEEHRRFLTAREVKYIIDHMGEPEIID